MHLLLRRQRTPPPPPQCSLLVELIGRHTQDGVDTVTKSNHLNAVVSIGDSHG